MNPAAWSEWQVILVSVVVPIGFAFVACLAMCLVAKRGEQDRLEWELLAELQTDYDERACWTDSPDPRDEWAEGLADEDPRLLMPEIRDFLAGVR